eukprot:227753-Pleurochrysis_carterae.AAC.1
MRVGARSDADARVPSESLKTTALGKTYGWVSIFGSCPTAPDSGACSAASKSVLRQLVRTHFLLTLPQRYLCGGDVRPEVARLGSCLFVGIRIA